MMSRVVGTPAREALFLRVGAREYIDVVKHDVQRGDGGYDPEQVVEDRDPVHGEQDAQIPAP